QGADFQAGGAELTIRHVHTGEMIMRTPPVVELLWPPSPAVASGATRAGRSHGPSILRILRRCRPPSNAVSSHTRTIVRASSSETVRVPSDRTLASLCARFQMAVCSLQ